MTIKITHEIQVAHRLSQTPGKCENIHGHSMKVCLALSGGIDFTGKTGGIDFTEVKAAFRAHLDEAYDHHLLLNDQDPLLHKRKLYTESNIDGDEVYPGLIATPGDPTVEHIAMWIYTWASQKWPISHGDLHVYNVEVFETSTNSVVYP